MFEKTKAAAAKAKEHLEVADLLAKNGYFAQAYAHGILSLEEASVAGIRLVTESGVISWENPPPWFKVRETDLSRPGTHRMKIGIGLTTAITLGALRSSAPPEGVLEEHSLLDALSTRYEQLSGLETLLKTDDGLRRVILEGESRKEASFYSTPKRSDQPSSPPPDEAECRRVIEAARPYVENLQNLMESIPANEEFERVRPLMVALFRGEGDRTIQEVRRLLGGEQAGARGGAGDADS
ncbi:MAG: hypothetical protein ACYDFT_00795 [Thermoplasmata archaeon]